MTVDELHTKMEAGFKAIRTEIAGDLVEFRKHVDAAIKADALETRRHLELIKDDAAETRQHVDAIKADAADFRKHVDAAVKAEGEATRLHFDGVAEQFKDYTKVLADGTARNTERLNDHETRITTLEGRSS